MSSRRAVAHCILSMILWGLLPIYWKAVKDVAPVEVLAHRILWSAVLLGIGIGIFGSFSHTRAALRNPRTRRWLTASTLLIACNWLLYIWAVGIGRVLECSMAYFMSPLVLVALGKIFLGEEWRPMQRAALTMIALALCVMAWQFTAVPWFAIGLVVTGAPYTLCRKKVEIDAMDGLMVEALLLSGPALLLLAYREASTGNVAFFHGSGATQLLLAGAGLVTAVPLWLFMRGMRVLHLKSVAMISYLAPTLQFSLGYFVYHETLDQPKLMAFMLIWLAVAIYLWDLWHDGRRQEKGIERVAVEMEEAT